MIMIKNNAQFDYFDLNVIFDDDELININRDFVSSNVVIDSRKVDDGSIFVALKGEKVDGHSMVRDAFENGAIACIVDKVWYNENKDLFEWKAFIITEDNLESLGKLANHHRLRFDIPIIAIGGSNGKTSTKEMMATMFSVKYNVLKTYENFNNLLGVPLMLLSLDKSYDIAILELGTNQIGEMYKLGKLVKPTHVLITNIGKEHLEFLIDIDGVEMEETSLFGEVRSNGYGFLNIDDSRLKNYFNVLEKYVTYGTSDNAHIWGEISINDNLHPDIIIHHKSDSFEINLKSYGLISAKNAIACAAVGIHFGMSNAMVKRGLEDFVPVLLHDYGRMVVEKLEDFVIINDCYNANPSSMESALDMLKSFDDNSKKIAILGDMKEMGENSILEHKIVLDYAQQICDMVLIVGSDMSNTFEMYEFESKVVSFENNDELINFLDFVDKSNSIILVKGSRSMKLEEVILKLKL